MKIGSGANTYEWQEHWAQIPDSSSARAGWAHHGVVVTESGEVVTYHPGEPIMMMFDPQGELVRSWPVAVSDAHGMTLVKDGDKEVLWVADNGRKRQAGLEYD